MAFLFKKRNIWRWRRNGLIWTDLDYDYIDRWDSYNRLHKSHCRASCNRYWNLKLKKTCNAKFCILFSGKSCSFKLHDVCLLHFCPSDVIADNKIRFNRRTYRVLMAFCYPWVFLYYLCADHCPKYSASGVAKMVSSQCLSFGMLVSDDKWAAQELKGKLERTQYEQILYVGSLLSFHSGCAHPFFKEILSCMI